MRLQKKSKNKERYYVNGEEVTDPKEKAKISIFIACFLGVFVAVLIFALVVITNQALNPGDFTYDYEEESHINSVTYSITVVDKTGEKGTPTKFRVNINSTSAEYIPTQVVTDFNSDENSKGEMTYTFIVQITGDQWASAEDISYVEMVTDIGTFKPDYHAGFEGIWIAYLAIGIFLIILTVLIIYNVKSAVRHFKEAKEELNNKIQATQKSIRENKTISEQETAIEKKPTQNSEGFDNNNSSKMTIKCPYCGALNNITSNRCQGCDAPLR